MKKILLIVTTLTSLTTCGPATAPAYADPVAVASTMVGRSENDPAFRRVLRIASASYPWCARFIRRSYEMAGQTPPIASDAVAAWDSNKVGPVVATPRRGDIAFRRWSHVEIVKSSSGNTVCTISGNSGNRVKSRCSPKSRFRKFRRPA